MEAFARNAAYESSLRTPGIEKARTCKQTGEPMRAKAYLKNPGVFGLHGVYKPLAVDLGIVDDEFRLGEAGYALLDTWEQEQNVTGFIDRAHGNGGSLEFGSLIRSAIDDSLKAGQSRRSPAWQGWSFFTNHLLPAQPGKKESDLIWRLLLGSSDSLRGEIFQLLAHGHFEGLTEKDIIEQQLLDRASPMLKKKLLQIEAYESFVSALENAFDWLRYLSSQAGARAIGVDEFQW